MPSAPEPSMPTDDAPSGVPPEHEETEPLGVPQADPDDEGGPENGEERLPGIVPEGGEGDTDG